VQSVESQPMFRRRDVPPKRRSTFNELNGVISQKTEQCITTTVRTSNLTPTFFNLLAQHLSVGQKHSESMKSIIFWDMTTCLLADLLNYSSTLKMEAISSSETSGTTLRTTRRHIPEDDTLQNHRCENLKSYTLNPCSLEHADCSGASALLFVFMVIFVG
jgi:hypothetical protein